MTTAKDIVSTIFKKFPNIFLTPKFIRDECTKICQQNSLECGDPGRIVREFAGDGFVKRDPSGNCLFDQKLLSSNLMAIWNNYTVINYDTNITAKQQPVLIDNSSLKDNYSLDELKQIYNEMVNQDIDIKKNETGIPVLFGIKYGKSIRKNNYAPKDICKWDTELNHGLKVYDYLANNTFNIKFYNPNDYFESNKFKNDNLHDIYHDQIIYYGVPGSGKSYKIDDQLKTHFGFTKEQIETNTMRVVFHPEYTNADFVGQVMPVISDSNTDTKVTYKFTPGPFTKILRKAYQHPDENYCLIIEEINRGNAAAIFGDIFQLLDRLGADESDDNFTQGWSKYFISNDYLNWYIRENVYDENDKDRDLGKAEKGEDVVNKAIKIEKLKFTENTGIRLPPNLSLLATMNTSDQNVFTLDNAFQRRWDMQLVENTFGTSDEEKNQQNAIIVSKDGNVTWENFQQEINSLISEKSNETNLSSMEDKRIGCWFVKAEKVKDKNKINISTFKNKVLKYLWDDAFKFCRQDVFEKGIDSFEKLQESFAEKGFTVIPALQGKLTFSKETPSPNADTGNTGNTGTTAEDTPQTEA